MKRVLLSGLLLLVSFSLFAAGARGRDEGPWTLRFGHVLSPADIPHYHMEQWARNVRDATDGMVNIEVFHSAQLGVEEDVLEQIRAGANMGWHTDFARLGSYVGPLAAPNASFFVGSLEEAMRLQYSPTLRRYLDQLSSQFGFYVVSFLWSQAERHVFAQRPARTPAEMAGMLIRSPPAPIWVESVNALGVTATPLAWGEIYTGIASGVVDGAEVGFMPGRNLRLYEVTNYVMETGHIFLLNTLVVSSAWLDRLPANYRRIVIDEANRSGLNSSRMHLQRGREALQELIDNGMTFIPREQLDIDAFRAASVQAYQRLGLLEVRDAIHAEIGLR